MKAHQILDRDEINRLTTPNDLQGWMSIAVTWSLIASAFAVVIAYPSVITIALALIILGGRQLALAVLAHECAHRSLFRTPWLNRVAGKWLCGSPIWVDVERYRVQHLGHHAHAGTDKDPDLGLASGFPVSRASFARKVFRDLAGISGAKRLYGLFLMDAGIIEFTLSDRVERSPTASTSPAVMARRLIKNAGPVAVTNAALATSLWAVGAPWAYLLWLASYMSTHSLFLRIRSIAEHACTERDPAPMRHTRTTLASPWARLTVAPHHVNFHAEHHLLPTAPHYHLPKIHRLLVERSAFDDGHLAPSYRDVLGLAVAT